MAKPFMYAVKNIKGTTGETLSSKRIWRIDQIT